MKNYRRILALLLAVMVLFTALPFTVSAEESGSDNSGAKLEIVPNNSSVWKPEIELNTEYTVTVPDGSSEDEAYYASFRTKDNRMYFVLNGKNISMPTENGLAKIQILDSEYNPVFGIGVAEGYEHSNAQKLNSYSRYYIKFFSDDKSSLNGGEMTFSLFTVPDPESDNFDNTTALEKGETREGNIAVPQDVDCFSFSKSNQEEFKCVIEPEKGTGMALLAELYTYDYDSETAQLVTSATGDETITIIARNASPNEYVAYRLKISSLNGGTGNYYVRYNDVRLYTDFQLNSYLSTSLDGYGEDTGTDYIRFTTAHKDAYYRIPVYNTDVKTGKTADEYLQAELLDENFALIDKISVEEGGSSQMLAKLSPEKVYYIKVYNGFSQDTEGGRYAVRIMYDFDEDRGLQDYALEAELGKIYSGKVETSYDNDWFKLTTSDSTRYLLVLENKSEEVIVEHENGNLELKCIRAVVYNEKGEEIDTVLASGEEKKIRKLDLKPNTAYYIRVYDPSATIADYDVILAERLILGDANLDESVKIQDATLIQKSIAKLAELEGNSLITADVNADGKINVKDATAIQKYIAKMETPYNIGEYIF
ncbi:MAG: dockerin type I repeat-containing protein [Ruminococcus sp.]|nr:dockerin type I repeat-containing protein [Ruminococcus sp.]